MPEGYKTIKISQKQQTAWITLDRPDKLNAINKIMLEELSEAMDIIEKDANIGCVIIRGKGKRAFSAGADLMELRKLTQASAKEFSIKGQQLFLKIEKISKPVVAEIGGYALGGGFELALACDFRVAADNAELGFPEINLGFIPAWGGTQRLPLIVGVAEAKRLIMLGDTVQASEAYKKGLVDKVVHLKELDDEVKALAQRLCECSAVALKYAKLIVNSVTKVSLDGLKKETEVFVQLLSKKETIDKIRAFGSQRNKK